jgi:hypothetical protein
MCGPENGRFPRGSADLTAVKSERMNDTVFGQAHFYEE